MFLVFVAIVIVITLHEFAHAWMANFLGDPTAKNRGRVSLNPIRHLDPVGTILIFLVGIGWGKPVPVNSFYFRQRKNHEALVALAGPLMNLFIAIVLLLPLKYGANSLGEPLYLLLNIIFDVSILLFAFNMLPFSPLDGSKVLQLIIPPSLERSYQNFLSKSAVYFIVFLVVDSLIIGKYFGFSILSLLIGWIVTFVKSVLFFGL